MFFLIGLVLTVLQLVVVVGLLYMPTCSSMSDDCPSSQWCPITGQEFGTSQCTLCANAAQTESEFNFTRFCHAIMPDVTDYVDQQARICRVVVTRTTARHSKKNPTKILPALAESGAGTQSCWQALVLAGSDTPFWLRCSVSRGACRFCDTNFVPRMNDTAELEIHVVNYKIAAENLKLMCTSCVALTAKGAAGTHMWPQITTSLPPCLLLAITHLHAPLGLAVSSKFSEVRPSSSGTTWPRQRLPKWAYETGFQFSCR